MKLGKLALRVTVGSLFIGHGTQKLRGWFGGPNLEGTDAMMESLDLRPARRNTLAAGISETGGGALLAAGLATPAAAAALTGTMITAIRKVHLGNGMWNASGGYEFNLVMIAAALSFADAGPGKVSLDRLFGIERKGAGWALAALAAGAAASTAAIEFGRQESERERAGSTTGA